MKDSIWVTGIGAITPLGNNFQTFGDNLFAGRSGVCEVPAEVHGGAPVRIGALSRFPDGGESLPHGDTGRPIGTRLEQVIDWCVVEALRDSGWWDHRHSVRVGVCFGSGAEWANVWQLDWLQGGRKVCHPEMDTASVVQSIQQRHGLRGPTITVAAACASANYALAQARHWLQCGLVDVCIAGGGDVLSPIAFAGFGNLRALSRRNADPQGASRPFDTERDGFVLGEGGIMFALERSERARRRSARVLAEFAGFGASSDAFHMIIPGENPEYPVQAVQSSLNDAQLNADQVDYVNAHATSTPVGDRAEARALRMVLGASVDVVPVSSTKSMTGHLLSGAAAIEAMACIAAIERQAVPPTLNLEHPDPECALLHVPKEARPHKVNVAISNSFGFGGSNTCAVFRKAV